MIFLSFPFLSFPFLSFAHAQETSELALDTGVSRTDTQLVGEVSSLQLLEVPKVGSLRTNGALTWVFQGEQTFDTPHFEEKVTYIADNRPPKDLVGRLQNLVMLDGSGEWAVSSVDETLLDLELLALADEQVMGWDPVADFDQGGGEFYKDTYYVYSCDGDPTTDNMRIWNTESRVKKTAPFTDRQSSTMFVNANCTGVLLRSNWVLTAAHCLKDDLGNWVYSTTGATAPTHPVAKVYDTTGSSRKAEKLVGTGAYSGGDWDHDWALIKLENSFSSSPSDMDLYTGADSAFDNIDDHVHKLGYPSYTHSIAGTCQKNDDGVVMTNGAEIFHQADAEVSKIRAKSLRYKADGAPRSSGSAYYFCPEGADDVCGAGELGKVIGVHAGFYTFGVNRRYVGPKATYFGPTAISAMDTL